MADSTSQENLKAKWSALFGIVTVVAVCGWLSIAWYSAYAYPDTRPKISKEEQEIYKRFNDVEKRVSDMEKFQKTLKIIVDIKRQVEE